MSTDSLHLPQARIGDIQLGAVSCEAVLDDGELVDALLSVDEVTTNHLVIDLLTVSTEELTINRELVPAGKAVQFRVDFSGTSVVAGTYCLQVTVRTDSTPAQTRTFVVQVLVRAADDCA